MAVNPRRAVLASLRETKGNISTLVSWWDQRQTVAEHEYEQTTEGQPQRIRLLRWRKRTDAEKIENDPAEWRRLATWARKLSGHLANLAAFAEGQARLAEDRRKNS